MVSKKINLGIIFQDIKNWQGGYNYFCSLISSFKYLENKKNFKFLVFTSKKNSFIFNQKLKLKKKNIFQSIFFEKKSLANILRKLLERIFQSDIILNKILKKNNIKLVTHYFKKNSNIYMIPWIPDLQHKFLINNFSQKEKNIRDKQILDYLRFSKDIIVSSNDTKKSLQKFYNSKKHSIHVLHFVPQINFKEIDVKNKIIDKFNIPKKYIYIPNQFWLHKNHEILIRTAYQLKKRNFFVKFVMSGSNKEYRNKFHYQNIKNLIQNLKVQNYFKLLGEVSRKDLLNLMYHAMIIINPSKYEGWSTVVEEAKILKKKILISNIPVHLEQKNKKCILFNNKSDLYEKIIFNINGETKNKSLKTLYKDYLSDRKRFALEYYKILEKYVSKK